MSVRTVRCLLVAAVAIGWLGAGTTARAQTEDILPPPVPGVEKAGTAVAGRMK